jgi:hypothetical protein
MQHKLEILMGTKRKKEIALDPNTPVVTLDELSKDESEYVRRGVAENPNTPVVTLDELSKDEYAGVRLWVAENPNTPQQVMLEV